MIHPGSRLRRGYNKLCAFATSFPRNHSQPDCSRLYSPGSVSISNISLHVDDFESDPDTEEFESTMGKSNKFDYTNRPNSGAKLGGIIGRDLEKEASKVVKEAEKQASKARKASIGSVSSTLSSSEYARDGIAHALDIKVPGKHLTDEGACALAEGLEIALRQGTSEASVLLEDLNLADNAITTVSLARMAPIISLARHDLKTLNLADNCIKVETREEAEQWEVFLLAFKSCLKLRRLDLSGNTKLGAKAMEVLARVYTNEEDITPLPPDGEASVHSLVSEMDYADQDPPGASSFDGPMVNGRVLRRRCGLRSIPYLTLHDIGLTDAGALWLSYVVQCHHYPTQLIDQLNATHADSMIRTYQQSASASGIDWSDRAEGLTKDGKSLLEKAERIRRQTVLMDHVTVASSEFVNENGMDDEENAARFPFRHSIDHRHPQAAKGDRRTSLRCIHTNSGGEYEISELESARKKIQRSIIQQYGASSVELWGSALRICITARVLSGLGPAVRDPTRIYTGPPMFDFGSTQSTLRKQKQSLRPVTPINLRKEDCGKGSVENGSDSPNRARRQGTYAATLTANTSATAGEPEIAITEVTNSPTTPKMIFKPHRKGAFSDGGDLLVQKLDALIVRSDNPHRFVRWQEDHMPNMQDGPNAFRNSRLPSHLPNSVIGRIASENALSGEGILSTKQRHDAVLWGLQRANFAIEKEWRKMADSAQVWTLLESLGCLTYQRE